MKPKTSFIINKTKTGYTMKIVAERLKFLKAFFTGNLSIEGDKAQADFISKSLYTSKTRHRANKKAEAARVSDK